MIRKMFRHKLVDIYMIICIFIAMATIIVGIHYYNVSINAIDDEKDSRYKFDYQISIDKDFETFNKNIYDIGELFNDEKNLNIIIDGVETYIEDAGIILADYIFCLNDTSKIPFIMGGYSENKIYNTPSVIIGRMRYNDNEKKDIISIGGTEYNVVGVIGSAKSEIWDNDICIIFDSISKDEQKKILSSNNLFIRFQTDDASDIKAIEKYKDELSNFMGRIVRQGGYNEYSEDVSMALYDNSVVFLMYVFAIINCLFSAILWVYVRIQEIVISRICGMSKNRIYLNLMKEILFICIFASIFLILCAGVAQMITHTVLLAITAREFFMIIGSIILTTLLISLVPMAIMNKKELYTMLVDSGAM